MILPQAMFLFKIGRRQNAEGRKRKGGGRKQDVIFNFNFQLFSMQVILKPLYHRRQECIGIYFEKDAAIQSAIQKQASCKWSKTNGCWYLPCTGENYLQLKTALENKAELGINELKKFLLEKKKNNPAQSSSFQNKLVSKNEIKKNPSTAFKQPVQQNLPID